MRTLPAQVARFQAAVRLILVTPVRRHASPHSGQKDTAGDDSGRGPLSILNAGCDKPPILLHRACDDEVILLGRLNGASRENSREHAVPSQFTV